jgi:hypothetical protein
MTPPTWTPSLRLAAAHQHLIPALAPPGGGWPKMKPGLKIHDGRSVGRDPREMTQDELRASGHEPMSPLEALRRRCLDCCVGQANEVAVCPVVQCPSWPFRMGTNPWRRPASEGRREAARRVMTKLNARRRKGDGAETSARPPEHGTAPSLAMGSGAGLTWATSRVDRDPEPELYRANGTRGTQKDGAVVESDQTAVALDRTPMRRVP